MGIEEIAILNGNIIAMDSKIPKCRAVFVKNGEIECIGLDEDIKKNKGKKESFECKRQNNFTWF